MPRYLLYITKTRQQKHPQDINVKFKIDLFGREEEGKNQGEAHRKLLDTAIFFFFL